MYDKSKSLPYTTSILLFHVTVVQETFVTYVIHVLHSNVSLNIIKKVEAKIPFGKPNGYSSH